MYHNFDGRYLYAFEFVSACSALFDWLGITLKGSTHYFCDGKLWKRRINLHIFIWITYLVVFCRWVAQAFGCFSYGQYIVNYIWKVTAPSWETSFKGILCMGFFLVFLGLHFKDCFFFLLLLWLLCWFWNIRLCGISILY